MITKDELKTLTDSFDIRNLIKYNSKKFSRDYLRGVQDVIDLVTAMANSQVPPGGNNSDENRPDTVDTVVGDSKTNNPYKWVYKKGY